jgi:hypothetical protein
MMGTQWVQQKSKKGDECTSKGGICQFYLQHTLGLANITFFSCQMSPPHAKVIKNQGSEDELRFEGFAPCFRMKGLQS